MTSYTGANLKARILITLAENPLDTRNGSINGIVKNEAMNEIRVHFSLGNMSHQVSGTLPMSDLPEIEAAVQENKKLQALWAEYQSHAMEHTRKHNMIYGDMHDVASTRYEKVKYERPDPWPAIKRQVALEFEPRFEALRQEMKKLSDPAQPGMAANPNLMDYLKSIDVRAEQISGIAKDVEAQQYQASPQWNDKWSAFIDRNGDTTIQKMMLRGFKAQSEQRVVADEKRVIDVLPRIGDVRKAFSPEKLAQCMAFANQMAYARAPFLPPQQGMQMEDSDTEEETEALRP